jgi:hypothetical protein
MKMSNHGVESGTTNPGVEDLFPVQVDEGAPPVETVTPKTPPSNTVEVVGSQDQGQLAAVLAQLQTLIAQLADGTTGSDASTSTPGYAAGAPTLAATVAYATALEAYVKKKEEVDRANRQIDRANASLDGAIAAAEMDMAMARVLLTNFDRLEAWFGKISPERMSEIAQDPTYFLGTDKQFTKEEVLAARYFSDNPSRLHALNTMYVRADGSGANHCTRSDLENWLTVKQAEIDSLKAKKQEHLAAPVPPVPPAAALATTEAASTRHVTPTTTANTHNDDPTATTQETDAAPPTEPPTGSALERALARVDIMRDRIETTIDAKTSKMQDLITADPEKNKEQISTLEREIKALSRQESMLTNLESMLEQMIQNIIKMRHDQAMNAIRHIT